MTDLFDLQDVSLTIDGTTVLGPLNLSIPAGRVIGLVGHNGSGKSSLIRLLARQQSPSTGTIRFEGRDLTAWKDRLFARHVAYLPQSSPTDTGLLVRELVALGRYPWHGAVGRYTDADTHAVRDAMVMTGVDTFADRFVDTLSGGERQRVWLAMLMAQHATCLLLDEPTSALDIGHQIEILSLVQRLARSRAISAVIVLHDINMAAWFCDDIIALRAGAVIASGRPETMIEPKVLKSIYDLDWDVLRLRQRLLAAAKIGEDGKQHLQSHSQSVLSDESASRALRRR